jgi:nicotinate-nucleotide adenylyltransferase
MSILKNIGLFFGSFNPIHIGHLVVAEMALEKMKLDDVWFVVSPENPAKAKTGELISEHHRLAMTQLATAYHPNLHASNVEFSLPKPSYTYVTLDLIKNKRPNFKFYIICGTDIQVKIPYWKNAQYIVENNNFIMYPRGASAPSNVYGIDKKTTVLKDIPRLDISSTFIRNQIKNNGTINHIVPSPTIEYIKNNNLYKQ